MYKKADDKETRIVDENRPFQYLLGVHVNSFSLSHTDAHAHTHSLTLSLSFSPFFFFLSRSCLAEGRIYSRSWSTFGNLFCKRSDEIVAGKIARIFATCALFRVLGRS